MLAMAEYTYNNLKHTSTKISPFYAYYGYGPWTNWPTKIKFRNPESELYGQYMICVNEKLKERLAQLVELIKKNYNK